MTSSTSDFEKVLHLLQKNLEEAQNDNLTLQAQIQELREQSKELGNDNDYLRKKIAGIQQDNSMYSNTQSRLETQLYAQEQDTANLRKQIQQLTKSKRDAEQKLEMELTSFETDRIAWQQKEADMYNQIRNLSLGGEPRTPRTPRRRSVTSSTLSPFGFPAPLSNIGEEGQQQQQEQQKRNSRLLSVEDDDDNSQLSSPKLATIDSCYARESKIAQRTIKAQDKMILDLKAEMDQQKSMVQDRDAQAQRQSLRIQQLEQEIANVKHVNQSLMEDNESYQILLHEKTISGEFMMNPIMQIANGDTSKSNGTVQPSTNSNTNGLNLAAELNLASDIEATQKVDNTVQKLTDEVKTLQDTNRALQLYMNKILMKIIDNKQLEDVLSIDQPKPKPIITTTTKESVEPAPRSAGLGPAPTRTLSSTLLNKGNQSRQQRRRTISYWGSKVPAPPPPSSSPVPTASSTLLTNTQDDRTTRRHSAMPSTNNNNNNNKENTNGGWAKALRRMSIGWSASPTVISNNNNKPMHEQIGANTTPPSSIHESTSSSSNEEVNHSLDAPRPLNGNRTPSMSRSASSSTSLRASNELATLQEE
ncbi:uncharacterized protein BX664DRAFT_338591 [Halteromyces radiatus]|uniref:uncharacterized protein n=1 Tax=Halteromyces radiatus TaxID=101107 RepID=UPI00221F6940|nr:uncharacterized protein BX664DRAFT_338591 [Halteromyces radiatus]KAI8085130.1 hypothetical protein BX664DRAFT_338591 [Halteromyces radiatus]